MNVPDKFCVAGDHGKWGAELRGDIGDDFLSKNIDAGGKIIFCEPVHRVLDCKDRLCEIFGVSGGGGAPAGRLESGRDLLNRYRNFFIQSRRFSSIPVSSSAISITAFDAPEY